MHLDDFASGLRKALALGGDTHSIEDVAQRILDGKAQLWVRGKGLIITEIEQYPQKKVLRFWLATGELHDVMELRHSILDWGRKKGCTYATIVGRRGWTKPLRTEGWTEAMVVLTKEL